MTDRELLELAANACGWRVVTRWEFDGLNVDVGGGATIVKWNPLTHDGAALRLAVKLRLNLIFEEWDGVEYACAVPYRSHQGQDEVVDDDENAATRRAIVHAAAELGKLQSNNL